MPLGRPWIDPTHRSIVRLHRSFWLFCQVLYQSKLLTWDVICVPDQLSVWMCGLSIDCMSKAISFLLTRTWKEASFSYISIVVFHNEKAIELQETWIRVLKNAGTDRLIKWQHYVRRTYKYKLIPHSICLQYSLPFHVQQTIEKIEPHLHQYYSFSNQKSSVNIINELLIYLACIRRLITNGSEVLCQVALSLTLHKTRFEFTFLVKLWRVPSQFRILFETLFFIYFHL